MRLPLLPVSVYSEYDNTRIDNTFHAEWSNYSLPAVRRAFSRSYDAAADRFHYYVPIQDIGHVGTDLDWPMLNNE
eukprot:558884-Lingulodinium_polyedra.AAC.1